VKVRIWITTRGDEPLERTARAREAERRRRSEAGMNIVWIKEGEVGVGREKRKGLGRRRKRFLGEGGDAMESPEPSSP